MTLHPFSDHQIRGRFRTITRVSWLLLVGTILIIFFFAVPYRFNYLLQPVIQQDSLLFPGLSSAMEAGVTAPLSIEEIEALNDLGISLRFYAAYILTFDIALVMIGTVVGFLIFWRKSDDWMAVWVSFIIVLLGTNGASLVVPSLVLAWRGWILVSLLFGLVGMVSNVYLLFLSPDGGFVPAWSRGLSVVFAGGMVGTGLYSSFIFLTTERLILIELLILVFPIWIALLGMGVFAQIYRYRRVSGLVQRQQTKWVAIGLASISLGFFINAMSYSLAIPLSGVQRIMFNLIRAPLVNLCMSLFPLTLAFSIFRYKLWDIDLIIRRTFIYGTLTACVGTLYIGTVIVLQSLFNKLGGQPSEIVIVLSTLAIAALFNPLRHRVQEFIDRRFYRKKYNAEQILAHFATVARDEVDMDKLTAALIGVVEETVQPERVSLWLISDRLTGKPVNQSTDPPLTN